MNYFVTYALIVSSRWKQSGLLHVFKGLARWALCGESECFGKNSKRSETLTAHVYVRYVAQWSLSRNIQQLFSRFLHSYTAKSKFYQVYFVLL